MPSSPGTDLLWPVAVEAREGFRIWLQYADGAEGEVDLSELAGKEAFVAWEDRTFFEKVYVADHRAIAWNDEIDLCADALYLEITGKSAEELWPGFR